MNDVAYVGQPMDLVVTIKNPDGTDKDITGYTAVMAVLDADGAPVTGSPFAGVVASPIVTATVPATVHVDANRGILTYYPIITTGGDNYPGTPQHYHLKEVG